MNPILVKKYDAAGDVPAYTIVKFSTTDKTVVAASDETDSILGVNNNIGAAEGDPIDVTLLGIAEVKLGGDVTRGDLITSDANGCGVKLTDAMLQADVCRALGMVLVSGVSGDVVPVLVQPQKASLYDALDASAAEINTLAGKLAGATITVGTENAGTGAINVAIQLEDAAGDALEARASCFAYLSDDEHGDSVVNTESSGTVAIGTDGLLMPIVAKKTFMLTSEADGDIDINIIEAGAKTQYLVLVMPNGSLVVSDAITHAE